MADQDDSADKSHEPTPRKLEQARKKGEIPRAPDLLTAMAYFGLMVAAAGAGGQSMLNLADVMTAFIEQPDRLRLLFFRDGAASTVGQLISASFDSVLPLFLVPPAFILLALLATRAILFTPSKLAPKISRISPIQNAKNKYGSRGLFEFLKSFVKLMVYSVILAMFLSAEAERITGIVRATPEEVAGLMTSLMLRFLMLVVIVAAVIGAIDILWQRADHTKRNRMSQKEMRDEHKESEGDPYMKQQRRMRGQEIAMQQMMTDVPKADVVIVNPTHFAVALKWNRAPGSAPVCVAKGTDHVAARIRECARDAGVPIHSDPPTARALHASVEIGQEVQPEHYKPVAAAIRFAEEMRRKVRERGWG